MKLSQPQEVDKKLARGLVRAATYPQNSLFLKDFRGGTEFWFENFLQKFALQRVIMTCKDIIPWVEEFGSTCLLLGFLIVFDDAGDLMLDVFKGIKWNMGVFVFDTILLQPESPTSKLYVTFPSGRKI